MCDTWCGVDSVNPKVTGRKNKDDMLYFEDLCDLGVSMLCFGWEPGRAKNKMCPLPAQSQA
jgi:hypothetical protein